VVIAKEEFMERKASAVWRGSFKDGGGIYVKRRAFEYLVFVRNPV
jgi:hypothetical protein